MLIYTLPTIKPLKDAIILGSLSLCSCGVDGNLFALLI